MVRYVLGFITSTSALQTALRESIKTLLWELKKSFDNTSRQRLELFGEKKPRLVLPELKIIYNKLGGDVSPFSVPLLATLIAIQDEWISYRASLAVDRAIEEWEELNPPVNSTIGVYSESGSGFFDEMRITSPWVSTNRP